MSERRAILFVVSAPSGAGKTTLCRRLLDEMSDLAYSVSSTTRPPRKGEMDGVDYEFLPRERFDRLVAEDAFLEYAEVHGNGYGTRRDRVFDILHGGRSVLLDVDVQGARQIRQRLKTEQPSGDFPGYVDVFVTPPSLRELRLRLEGRGQDSEEVIARRLRNAARELEEADLYKYQVINDHLDQAYRELREIYLLETSRNPYA